MQNDEICQYFGASGQGNIKVGDNQQD